VRRLTFARIMNGTIESRHKSLIIGGEEEGHCGYDCGVGVVHGGLVSDAVPIDVGPVCDAVPVDVLLALSHWPYNNPILIAPGGWSYERASQPAKFELVTLII
jgi:hypothetical protein